MTREIVRRALLRFARHFTALVFLAVAGLAILALSGRMSWLTVGMLVVAILIGAAGGCVLGAILDLRKEGRIEK